MRWLAPASAILLLAACTDRNLDRVSEDSRVATFEGGALTYEDVAKRLLELPPARRPAVGALDEAWLREFVSEMVVDRLLDRQAELTGFDNDLRVFNARQEIERSQVWSAFLRENMPPASAPEESELRAEFERRLASSSQKEQRKLSLIFLRRKPGESNSELRGRAAELRRRHLGGESFAALAVQYSDSESRADAGLIGWIEDDQLEPVVSDIVFSLGEGETSKPIVTREGAHLFRIDSIRAPAEIDFEEARDALQQQMAATEQLEAVRRLAGELPEPAGGFFVASEEELAALEAAGDPTAVVLRAGGYEVRLSRLLDSAGTEAGARLELLETLALRERVFAAARSSGLDQQPHLQRNIALAIKEETRRLLRQDGMRRLLGAEDDRLRGYFDQQEARFSTPLELNLEQLSIPAQGREKEVLLAIGDRLRSADGALDLQVLAEEFGGTVEPLGWVSIQAFGNQAAEAGEIASLRAGQVSTPRHRPGVVEMLAVLDRREPTPRSLSAVLGLVRDAYLEEHGQSLYAEWRTDLLTSADLSLRPMRLESIREALAPPNQEPVVGAPD